MKGRHEVGDPQELAEDYRERQRNIVWPGPLINGTRVDRFLWNGCSKPRLVQRVASWLIGSFLFMGGLTLFGWAIRERASYIGVALFVTLACGYSYAGIRIFLNGFGKRLRGPVLVPGNRRHRS